MQVFYEKNRDEKSHDTVPLKLIKMLPVDECYLSYAMSEKEGTGAGGGGGGAPQSSPNHTRQNHLVTCLQWLRHVTRNGGYSCSWETFP